LDQNNELSKHNHCYPSYLTLSLRNNHYIHMTMLFTKTVILLILMIKKMLCSCSST